MTQLKLNSFVIISFALLLMSGCGGGSSSTNGDVNSNEQLDEPSGSPVGGDDTGATTGGDDTGAITGGDDSGATTGGDDSEGFAEPSNGRSAMEFIRTIVAQFGSEAAALDILLVAMNNCTVFETVVEAVLGDVLVLTADGFVLNSDNNVVTNHKATLVDAAQNTVCSVTSLLNTQVSAIDLREYLMALSRAINAIEAVDASKMLEVASINGIGMLVTLLEWGYTSQQIKDAFLFDYSISLECDDVGRQIRRTINIENCDELLVGERGVRVSPNNTRPGVFVEFDERSDVGSDNGNSDDALPQEDPIDTTEPPGTGDEPADYDQNLTMGVNPSVNTCGLNELDFAGPNSGFEPSQVFQFRTDTDRADWICSKEITGSLLDVCGMGIKINSVEYTLSTNFNRLLPRLCGRR